MHFKIEVMSFPVVLNIIGTPHSSMANYVGENRPIFFSPEIPSQIIDRARCKLR